MGIYQAVYAIGMFSGPIVGGFIGDKMGLGGVFYCGGAIYAASAVVSLVLLPGKRTA